MKHLFHYVLFFLLQFESRYDSINGPSLLSYLWSLQLKAFNSHPHTIYSNSLKFQFKWLIAAKTLNSIHIPPVFNVDCQYKFFALLAYLIFAEDIHKSSTAISPGAQLNFMERFYRPTKIYFKTCVLVSIYRMSSNAMKIWCWLGF